MYLLMHNVSSDVLNGYRLKDRSITNSSLFYFGAIYSQGHNMKAGWQRLRM